MIAHVLGVWRRLEDWLQSEPLAFLLVALGALQLVAGLVLAMSWEKVGLRWTEPLPYWGGPVNPSRVILSGILASIGVPIVLAMPRYRLWLFLSLALAQGLVVNLPQLWILVGVLCVVAVTLEFIGDA